MNNSIETRHLIRFMVAFLILGAVQCFAGMASLGFANWVGNMSSNVQYCCVAGGGAIMTATFIQAMRHHDSLGALGHVAVGGGLITGLAVTAPAWIMSIPGAQAAII